MQFWRSADCGGQLGMVAVCVCVWGGGGGGKAKT